MNPSHARNSEKSASSERAFTRALCAALVLYSFFATAMLAYVSLHKTVAISPSGSSQSYEIGNDFASKTYLADLAMDVLGIYGNVTPDNIGYVRDRMLQFADGEGHGEIKTQFAEVEARVRREQVSTVWSPRDAIADPVTKTVIATGYVTTYLGSVLTSKVAKSYTIQFRVNSRGRAYVTRLFETEKSAK